MAYTPLAGTPDTLAISYDYDQAGRLSGIPSYIASTTYNARGQVASMIYANGAWVFNSFSPTRGWMDQVEVFDINGVSAFSSSYTRAANGAILSASATDDQGDFAYTYDYAGRLLLADNLTNDAFDQAFTYDAGGNMVTNSELGTYLYPAATAAHPHSPDMVGSESFTYDANGNMLADFIAKT